MHCLNIFGFEHTLSLAFSLKMLGLYRYTLIIGHKYCNVRFTKKINIVKGIANFLTNNGLLDKKGNTTTTKQKIKLENPCRNRGLNP